MRTEVESRMVPGQKLTNSVEKTWMATYSNIMYCTSLRRYVSRKVHLALMTSQDHSVYAVVSCLENVYRSLKAKMELIMRGDPLNFVAKYFFR